ncbi:TRAFAC clade GTPase domain-containing protein [Streptosporangium sp. CA-135522]|uniref:TRAFAC clade GTPase domain-containing protein n=1 Tax=Streptosporangium sp. CA-135522 TaxID=3240072 RepID=UPI003D92A59B
MNDDDLGLPQIPPAPYALPPVPPPAPAGGPRAEPEPTGWYPPPWQETEGEPGVAHPYENGTRQSLGQGHGDGHDQGQGHGVGQTPGQWPPPVDDAAYPPPSATRPRGRSRARKTPGDGATTVVCPYCLWELDWEALPLVLRKHDEIIYLEREPGESETRWLQRTANAERICDADGSEHYLPCDYGDYKPMIIGIVGSTAAGKTHLLAAMIDQLVQTIQVNVRHNLTISPLDTVMHRQFMLEKVFPFTTTRKVLGRTRREDEVAFVCALRARNDVTGEKHALVFFDVSGEFFDDADLRSLHFISIVDALLFVADGEKLDEFLRRSAPRLADPAFMEPFGHIDRLRNPRQKAMLPLPAALVVAKSDLLRWLPLVDGWLRADDDMDLDTVEEETEEAYVFLQSHNAQSWLHPVVHCQDSTIHFVSASGVAKMDDTVFPERGFGPRRVLRPLLSLLAMKGIIQGHDLGRDDIGLGPS